MTSSGSPAVPVLAVDLETFSSADLTRGGVYRYTQAEDFEILLFGYAFDDGPIEVIDLARGKQIPDGVLIALADPAVVKTAFNANFERTCLAKHFNIPMPPEQWRCCQAHALTLGLPASLEGVAKCLKLPQQKISEGKSLIRYFSMPCKPTKANGGRNRNLPHHDVGKWETFKLYCKQDVEVERFIRKQLENYPLIEKELKLWCLDQKINDFGVKVETQLVENAIYCNQTYQDKLLTEAFRLTQLNNPNSPTQLKTWLKENHQIEAESLSKARVAELLDAVNDPTVKRVLKLRQEMSKTSVKKYEAMSRAVGADKRIRGLLQYYGAATGRWAGRLVQVHNLPRNSLRDLDLAREILLSGDYETLELLFESVPDVLSQLIRTAFIPSPGCRFIVADFSAIEARIIAWLAGERWRMEVFNSHGKIYEASAAQMFGVPVESITKGSPLRQKGKIAELALGYQGSIGALTAMGALNMGLAEDELPVIVSAWRQSNPNIVKLWRDVERAAITAVRERTTVTRQQGLKFSYQAGVLFIRLPSGRSLAYARPRIELNQRCFHKEKLTYEGMMLGKWRRIDTYGGKLTENIIQAIARDCLAESLLRLDAAGYKIPFHVHDEVVLEAPLGFGSLQEVEVIMSQPIGWAPALPMRAEAFETDYYMSEG